ncbi:MAG: mechanosensitive ion channel family protein [bacterium]|nr:mechanosensitive ion channel family protein [bacterium]
MEINDFLQSFLDACYRISLWQVGIALVIATVAILLRRLFSKAVLSPLQNYLDAKASGAPPALILEAFSRPLGFAFIILGVHVASIVLILPSDIDHFVGRVVSTLTTFTVFWAIYRSAEPFSFVLDKVKLTGELKGFFITLTRILVLVIGVLSVLQGWGVNVGAFLAGLGLMTMAIGLAAQDTLKNFFGSLSIFMERTFKKGDWIQTPDVEGTIEAVSIRTTAVRRFDKALVTIPNAKLADAAVVNYTRMTNRRILWRIGLTYSTSSKQLESIVKKIRQYLEDNPKIETNPKKTTTLIHIDCFSDSAIEIFCYFFTKTTKWADYMQDKEDCVLAFKRIIEEEGGEIAYPSQSLYVEGLEKLAGLSGK